MPLSGHLGGSASGVVSACNHPISAVPADATPMTAFDPVVDIPGRCQSRGMRSALLSAWMSFSIVFVCAVTPVLIKDRAYPLFILVSVVTAGYVVGTLVALGIAASRFRRQHLNGS